MKNVTIYSTPTCGFCQMAKEFFKENNVEFSDFDVSQDTAKAEEMRDKTNQMGVPVIVISEEGADEEIIIGFDKDKLTQSLGL